MNYDTASTIRTLLRKKSQILVTSVIIHILNFTLSPKLGRREWTIWIQPSFEPLHEHTVEKGTLRELRGKRRKGIISRTKKNTNNQKTRKKSVVKNNTNKYETKKATADEANISCSSAHHSWCNSNLEEVSVGDSREDGTPSMAFRGNGRGLFCVGTMGINWSNGKSSRLVC